jgi:hypothetical protein
MSSPTHLRPLGFGEILDGAFTLFRRHFPVMFSLVLAAYLPLSVAMVLMRLQARTEPSFGTAVPMMVLSVMGLLLMVVVWGALTWQASQAYTGGDVSVGAAARRGLRAFLPLVGAGILAYLVLVVVLFALAIPVGVLSVIVALVGGKYAPMLIGGVAAVLMVGGMLAASSALFAVVPAVVVERRGPIAALSRSYRLSVGARLRVLGIMLVGWVITMLPAVGVMAVTGGWRRMLDPRLPDTAPAAVVAAEQLFQLVGSAFTTPFLVAALVLLYYDRRVRSEGLDLEVAASGLAPVPA